MQLRVAFLNMDKDSCVSSDSEDPGMLKMQPVDGMPLIASGAPFLRAGHCSMRLTVLCINAAALSENLRHRGSLRHRACACKGPK